MKQIWRRRGAARARVDGVGQTRTRDKANIISEALMVARFAEIIYYNASCKRIAFAACRETAIYARAVSRRRVQRRRGFGHVLELRRLVGVVCELTYLSRVFSAPGFNFPPGVALLAGCSIRAARGVARDLSRVVVH